MYIIELCSLLQWFECYLHFMSFFFKETSNLKIIGMQFILFFQPRHSHGITLRLLSFRCFSGSDKFHTTTTFDFGSPATWWPTLSKEGHLPWLTLSFGKVLKDGWGSLTRLWRFSSSQSRTLSVWQVLEWELTQLNLWFLSHKYESSRSWKAYGLEEKNCLLYF